MRTLTRSIVWILAAFIFLLPAYSAFAPAAESPSQTVQTDPLAEPPRAWRPALPGYTFRFPRDHGAHPAYRTEWWYFTGHLAAPDGARHAFMLTFFRTGLRPPRPDDPPRRSRWALKDLYFAHFALLDVKSRRHRYFERMSRGALEQAGADQGRLNVWLRDWRATGEMRNGRTVIHLTAKADDIALRLTLAPTKPPAVHGQRGVSQKADGPGRASHYYSLSRLAASGRLTAGGQTHTVTGLAWMDHEFGSNQLAPDQVGWDWISLQMSDGRELMLYLMRRKGGAADPNSSGTLVGPAGGTTHLPLRAFRFEPTGRWKSPASGAVYPMGWRVRVPAEGIDLTVRPLAEAQELRTAGSTRVTYWEGAVQASGTAAGQRVTARGFVEMTGYAEEARPKF